MRLPAILRDDALLFLEGIPGLADEGLRRFLVTTAELDEVLQGRIGYGGGTEEFCAALLLAVTNVELLQSRRDPLADLIKAAMKIAGPQRRNQGDALLSQLRAQREGRPYSVFPESGVALRRSPPTAALQRPRMWTQREILRHLRSQELERVQEECARVSRSDRPRICFLYGKSGAGKTTFLDLATTEALRAEGQPWWLKPFLKGPLCVTVPQGGMALPLVEKIREACDRAGLRGYLRDFDRRLDECRENLLSVLDERLDRIAQQSDPSLRENLVQLVAHGGLVAFNWLTSQSCAPTPDDAQLLARLLNLKLEVIRQCFEWWRSHISSDKRLTRLSIVRRDLPAVLGEGLKKCSGDHKFLFLSIDGFDSACTEDLVKVVGRAGPRVFWLIAGRFDVSLNPTFARLSDSSHAHFSTVLLQPLGELEVREVLGCVRRDGQAGSLGSSELQREAARIHRLTGGTLPYVEMALQTLQMGRNVEDHLGQVFWQHLQQNLDAQHRSLVYAFLLTEFESRQDRFEILQGLSDPESLDQQVLDLCNQCPVVTDSATDLMQLDTHFSEMIRSFLTSPAVRGKSDIMRIHNDARACLTMKKRRREEFRCGELRFRDERWQEIELARLYHSFHLEPDRAWPELAPVLAGAWLCRQDDFIARLLEMLQSIRALFQGANSRLLDCCMLGLSERAGREEKVRLLDELEKLVGEEIEGSDPWIARDLLERLRQEVGTPQAGPFGLAELFPVVAPEPQLVPVPGPSEEILGKPEDDPALAIAACWRHAEDLLDRGDESAAILAFRILAEHSVPTRIRLGDLYSKLESWGDAREMYLWALRSDPHEAAGLLGVAESLLRLGLFQEAHEYFRQARAALPGETGPLMGFLHTGRKMMEVEKELEEGAPREAEGLESESFEAEAFLEADEVELYDRACLAALLEKPEQALRLLIQAMRRDPDCRERAAADPYLEHVRLLVGDFATLQSRVSGRGAAIPPRQPVYLLLGCHSRFSGLLVSPESGLSALRREISRTASLEEVCWLGVITFGGEARQTVPLTSVQELNLHGPEPADEFQEMAALGSALEILRHSLCRELVPANSDFPEGDHGAWIVVMLDCEPHDEWRPALHALHASRKIQLERLIVLGLGEVNYSTLREIAPGPPHEAQQMPDVTPERLSAFFSWLCAELSACLGRKQPSPGRVRRQVGAAARP